MAHVVSSWNPRDEHASGESVTRDGQQKVGCTMTTALQMLFSSLVNGSVFALLGLGIVLCYRSSRVVNLAQGETYSAAGLLTAKLFAWGIPLAAASMGGVLVAVVGSLVFERAALRSRLHWEPGRLIMVALGVALLVEGVENRLAGATQYSFPSLVNGASLRLHGAAISREEVVLVVFTIAVTASLAWFFRKSLVGQAMSAASENPRASSLMGINVARMRQLSFGLAGLLGAVAALLVVPLNGMTYDVGLTMTLNGFVAAAFANMVSPSRTLLAGLALGLAEGLVGTYWSSLFAQPVAFGVLLLVGVAYLSRGERFGGAVRA